MLRDAGSLFNKINCKNSDLELLSESLSIYYNLHALFFPDRVTLTIWTMGIALRYHAIKLYEEFSVGYGIVSCQSKEAKHASIKKIFHYPIVTCQIIFLTINGGRSLEQNI